MPLSREPARSPPRARIIEGAEACSAGQSRSHFRSTDDRGRDNVRVGRQLDRFGGPQIRQIGLAVSIFSALQRRGVPSRLLYFPDEGHWVLKPQNSQLWYKTVLEWLDQYLKP